MKQRFLQILFISMLIPVGVLADVWQDPATKVNYEYTVGVNEAKVMAGKSFDAGSKDVSGDISILPKFTVNGVTYTVTTIGTYAFTQCRNFTSIIIPEGVTSIEKGAFSGCHELTDVTIPSTMKSFGNCAFANCSYLTNVHITDLAAWCQISSDKGKGSNPLTTATHLFLNGSEVTNLFVPSGVTSIGQYAFAGWNGLKKLTIPKTVTEVGEGAFGACTALIELTCGANIGQAAFSGCTSLTKVTLLEGVSEISEFAFFECENLTDIAVPASLTKVGIGNGTAFGNCKNITNIHVTDLTAWCQRTYELKGLWSSDGPFHLFMNGQEVKDLVIPNGMTTLCSNAFSNFASLTSVTISQGLTSIGSGAFSGCSGLTAVHIKDLAAWCGIEIGQNANPLKNAHHLFLNNEELKEMVIPEGVTAIGAYAFEGCQGLTSVTIPNSVTCIGLQAFMDCSSLTEVHSMIEQPFAINDAVFQYWDGNGYEVFTSATLYVPKGAKEKYQATNGWKNFTNIVEMADLEPIDEDDNVDYGDGGDINDKTNLSGTVVNNMFYNIGVDNGGYSAEEGCIVITKETSDEQIELIKDLGIADRELQQNFTGIILKVPEGKGTVTVTAETTGNMMLKVKVGDGEPFEMELSGKLKMKVPYNVREETLVYIFAGTTGVASVRGVAAEPSSLKIYGIEWQPNRKPGDINNNGEVEDEDVDAFIELYLDDEIPEPGDADFSRFDANGDGIISLADAVAIFYLSNGLNFDGTDPNAARMAMSMDNGKWIMDNDYEVTVEATELGNGIVRYTLRSDFEYAGFAIDVKGAQVVGESAEGMTLRSAETKGKHRIVAYNFGQAAAAGTVLTLDVLGEAQFSNINFSDANAQNISFRLGETTGIGAKPMDNGQWIMDHYYDLNGREWKSMKKGVNIIQNANGTKKMSVK